MKKYISILLITLGVAGSSCKKTYLSELAINPNTPASTTPALALAGALKITAGLPNSYTNYNTYATWVGYISWGTTFQPNAALELYSINTSTYDLWTPYYGNIANYSQILNSTTEPYFLAIAHIMIAYDYEGLVDNYNNVPYSQAIQGIGNLTPAYDTGSAIYDDLLKQLDAAIVLIQNGQKAAIAPAYPGKADIMYGAATATAMNNWIKFANTLKLRLAIRQSNITSKFAALSTAVQATSSLGYIDASSEGVVNPGYSNSDANGGDQQPLDLAYGYTQSGSTQAGNKQSQANTFSVNFFIGNGTPTNPDDPRLFQIYAKTTSTLPSVAGTIVSTAFGATGSPQAVDPTSKTGFSPATPSKFSAFLLSPTKSAVVFSASESYFLQAEAYESGLLSGGTTLAQTAYTSGITTSFTELGLTAAQAATYEALPQAVYPAAGTFAQKQAAIITQKWAALNPAGADEAWHELERTGIPNVPLSITPGSPATKQITRIPYPIIEYSTNAVNVGTQGTIDIFNSKIFWAK